MLGKLAVRNVRRSVSSYLIYFITVALTVALMFSINNVLFSDVMLSRVRDSGALKAGLGFATAVVALIVAFVISYAGSFMLKLRKREFGTYLTLGMRRGDVLKLFGLETLLIGAVSLVVGILVGLGLFQGLMLLVRNLMEMDAGLSSYSWQALMLTCGIVALMFAVSTISSTLYLKRVRIHRLLHPERYHGKRARPVLWGCVALLALGGVVACVVSFTPIFEWARLGDALAGYMMLLDVVALILAVFLFSLGLAKSATGLLLKAKRFRAKGANTFVLRQLTAKLNTNAVLFGVLAVLMTCAVVASNFSFTLKANEDQYVATQFPFSASAAIERGETPGVTVEKAEALFEETVGVTGRVSLPVYRSNDMRLTMQSYYGRYYENRHTEENDVLLALSDFNRLLAALGRQPAETDGYIVLDCENNVETNAEKFRDYTYTLGGMTLTNDGVRAERFGLDGSIWAYIMTVVPDAALSGMTPVSDFYAWQFVHDNFDGAAMLDALRYDKAGVGGLIFRATDFRVRRAVWEQSIANTAIWIVAAIYISVVLVFVSMAILALKVLSDTGENRRRYETLYKLGLGTRGQSAALFKEISAFFVLPFLLPFLIAVPTVLICASMLGMMGFSTGVVYVNGAVLVGVFALIYFFYLFAAFAVSRNNVIRGFKLE